MWSKTASPKSRRLFARSRKRFSLCHCSLHSSFNQVVFAFKKWTAINKEKRISRGILNVSLLVVDGSYFDDSVICVCAGGGDDAVLLVSYKRKFKRV